jgi:hypothetical protein
VHAIHQEQTMQKARKILQPLLGRIGKRDDAAAPAPRAPKPLDPAAQRQVGGGATPSTPTKGW